ncbi:PA-phosphatase [Halobacteriales archaeon QS_3_64_16]|nr:MAG: PA-phosphatase [Halobacteriales archaeon QS_3_64_16]
MTRSVGVSEAIRAALTEPVVLLAAVVTLAGDAGTLLAISLGAYWLGAPVGEGLGIDRRQGAFVLACALGAFSLTAGLKALFALPRPSIGVLAPGAFETVPAAGVLQAFVESAASASGYGFPSGHAIGSTVVYGALALVSGIGTRRQRWAGAGLVIALVSLSRVVLGVHYLMDVLVGIAIGIAFLATVVSLARGADATRAFALAVFLGVLAVLPAIGDAPRDAIVLLGVSTGAMSVWLLLGEVRRPTSERERLGTLLTGAILAGIPGALIYVLDLPLHVEFLASVAVGAAAIGTPRIASSGAGLVRSAGGSETDQNVSR